MAANASKTPLLRFLAKRNFAASANPAVNPASNIQVSTLSNKVVVASADSVIPGVAKVSVAFRAGSRYERDENQGASHILRSSCGLSTACTTQFAITRNLQLMGAGLSATSDCESVAYTIETSTNHLNDALPFLKTVAVEQAFKPWELKDNVARVKNELKAIPPQALLFDLAHSAAYRKGLGNSIFVRQHKINKIGSETLQHFVNENFKSNKASVTGVGITHDALSEFATKLNLECGPDTNGGPSKYYGGEVRKETPGDHTFVMIAGEASSLQKKELFAWSVLACALGSGSRVKYSTGASPLGKVSSSVPTSQISAVHIPHSDSGLLGIAISSHSHYSAQCIEGVMKALKIGSLSEADVARGKAILKHEFLSGGDSTEGLLAILTYQSLLIGSVSTPGQLASAVDAVSEQQVNEVLKKFLSGKKAMAALGNIHNTPYLEDLA